jgi:small subunit ribosomal protein S6
MKKYELLLVLPGTLDEKEAEKQVTEIKESLAIQSKDIEVNNLGKVRLAYPIKQIRYGYYYTMVFSSEPEAVAVISNKLKLRSDVLRSMITLFNTNVASIKKIVYNTNEVGVTTMVETGGAAEATPAVVPAVEALVEEKVEEQPVAKKSKKAEETKIDLKEIDEKLNAILNNENIIPGV